MWTDHFSQGLLYYHNHVCFHRVHVLLYFLHCCGITHNKHKQLLERIAFKALAHVQAESDNFQAVEVAPITPSKLYLFFPVCAQLSNGGKPLLYLFIYLLWSMKPSQPYRTVVYFLLSDWLGAPGLTQHYSSIHRGLCHVSEDPTVTL